MLDGVSDNTSARADAVRRRNNDRRVNPPGTTPDVEQRRAQVDPAAQSANRRQLQRAQQPAATSPDDQRPGPALRRGSRGESVRQLQQQLRERGHDPGPVDGRFGPRTERAVRAFQRANSVRGDGVVGARTREALVRGTPSRPNETRPSETRPETPPTNQPAGPQQVDTTNPAANPRGQLGTSYRDWQNRLQNGVQVEPRVRGQVDQAMQRVEQNRELIDQIARRANVPRELVAGLWFRENSQMRNDIYLHNGQRLGSPTTLVPRGINFRRDQFVDAAVHALNQKRGLRDQLGLHYGSRDVAAMAAFAEGYNGFGYRNRGATSAYVASGTPQYTGGMYVRDGVFSRSQRDPRPGVLPIIAEMMRRGL